MELVSDFFTKSRQGFRQLIAADLSAYLRSVFCLTFLHCWSRSVWLCLPCPASTWFLFKSYFVDRHRIHGCNRILFLGSFVPRIDFNTQKNKTQLTRPLIDGYASLRRNDPTLHPSASAGAEVDRDIRRL